jgi:hypothetical protein
MKTASQKRLPCLKPKRFSKKRPSKESALFGSPSMKMIREVMRKHVDVMETEKACAEAMLSWIARDEMWSRQVDEYYSYRLLDKQLSVAQNKRRFAEYTKLQRDLHERMAQDVEHMLRCYGAGKDNIALLAQMAIAAMRPPIGEGGVGEPANGDAEDPTNNWTLKLLCASFADKAITYKMPHPELNIPGMPDEEEQATPRQPIKKTMREMQFDSGKKIS